MRARILETRMSYNKRRLQNFRSSGRSIRRSFSAVSGAKIRPLAGGMSAEISGKRKFEILWRDLFSDPTRWWDNRAEKPNARFPDFKHKQSGEPLWLKDGRNPPWVAAEVAKIAAGVSILAGPQQLSRYNKAGQFEKTLELFEQMQKDGIVLDGYVFLRVFNACAALQLLKEGRGIHQLMIETGCKLTPYLNSALVDMYAKCGSIDDAWRVFDKMPERNIVCWNAMILGFVKCGQGLKALALFQTMRVEGVEPDSVTFVGLLNACASVQGGQEGRRVHEQIIQTGFELDLYVSSALVDMYAKCRSIEDAWNVFDNMPKRNVVCWNAMILGFVKCGQGLRALELLQKMQQEGVQPDLVTFTGSLNACASIGAPALEEGRCVHQHIIQSSCETEEYVNSSLVDMYAKCGSIDDALRVFNKIPTRSVVAWSAMIVGLANCGQGREALELFQQMQAEGVHPHSVTFLGLLNACATTEDCEEGKRIHKHIIESGCEGDEYVANSLVDMYAKCGKMDDAWILFNKMPKRNVFGWTAMILGFVKSGQGPQALQAFQGMLQEQVEPDSVTFVGVLNACASTRDLTEGKQIHKHITQSGFEGDLHVGTSLVDMYAKCGSIEDAWKVFSEMPKRNVVCWNAMIQGFVRCRQGLKALELYQKFVQEGIEPDSVTFVVVLNACASVAALETGKCIHRQIIESSLELDPYVSTSLVDMYVKCGDLDCAKLLFDKMPTRNVASWNAMIMGYAMHGHAKEAVRVFEWMSSSGSEMDETSFTSLLSACSHGGLVMEGVQYFDSMASVYGVPPTLEHYTCMVDLLGRAGHLDDAEEMIKTMPFESAAVWMSLLGACRIYGNLEMGERASKQILELEPDNASAYVLLSNMYAAAGHSSRTETSRSREGTAWVHMD